MSVFLGRLVTGDAERDAIHLAVAPVVAGERLSPGQPIGFTGEARVGAVIKPIGIVDPFLPGPVFKGERFWMCLFPNTVTSLRHQWEHPAFSGKCALQSTAEAWLTAFADEAGISYGELLQGATDYLANGDYMVDGGKWEGVRVPDDFWPHYEAVTGTTVPVEDRGSFFSCSC